MIPSHQKIFTRKELQTQIAQDQAQGLKIVFTNGCFDLMHLGHVTYLEASRALGDRLVVALNTDASVSTLKGPQRPIVSEEARLRVMAALQFVDYVTLFGEDTPLELIQLLKPNVLVKGADYALEDIVGAREVLAMGGEVERIPLVEGFSTSDLVRRIQQLKP